MNRNAGIILAILLATGMMAVWMLMDLSEPMSPGIDKPAAEEETVIKGPHRGRLLMDGNFALEVTVFEAGIPPEFHVYAYDRGKPVSPEEVELRMELKRLGGRIDRFSFSPQADYLRGSGVVAEPHSFDVSVAADYQGKTFEWVYASYEGRTRIPNVIAAEAGIKTETAGPVSLRESIEVTGRVHTDPDRLSRVRPRFPGVVQTVNRSLGDVVRSGEVLATVQSNESLETYAIKAPIGGQIIRRDTQVGEPTSDEPLFIIADLSRLWVELDIFGRDLDRVKAGQQVEVERFEGHALAGKIEWISPLASHASQSVRARVPLANPDGKLRPGQFVRGRVTVGEQKVPLAVRQSAIQTFRDFQVVFARFGETYEVRMLDLGRSNRHWVEVTGGLEPGTEYVTDNSFLLKADIEKSGAAHDH